jgi:nitrite reductase (NADH) small subunit
MIENGKVVCPWHGWQWDPKTGEAAHSANAKVAVYPLKIENGECRSTSSRCYPSSRRNFPG